MRAEIVSGSVLGKTKTMMLRSACKVFIAFGCVWFCFGFEALVKSMGLFWEGKSFEACPDFLNHGEPLGMRGRANNLSFSITLDGFPTARMQACAYAFVRCARVHMRKGIGTSWIVCVLTPGSRQATSKQKHACSCACIHAHLPGGRYAAFNQSLHSRLHELCKVGQA